MLHFAASACCFPGIGFYALGRLCLGTGLFGPVDGVRLARTNSRTLHSARIVHRFTVPSRLLCSIVREMRHTHSLIALSAQTLFGSGCDRGSSTLFAANASQFLSFFASDFFWVEVCQAFCFDFLSLVTSAAAKRSFFTHFEQ